MKYNIPPVAKPRMTQRDKFMKRTATDKYWSFKASVRAEKVRVENGDHITFGIPMPLSWSIKKRKEMDGTPHLKRPDKDNLEKALLDAIYDEDSHIYDTRTTKAWSYDGYINIEKME